MVRGPRAYEGVRGHEAERGAVCETDRKVSIRTECCGAGGIALVPITAQIEGIEWIILLVLLAMFVLFIRFMVRLARRNSVHEVVKTRCRRCGALNPEKGRFCASCGAPL